MKTKIFAAIAFAAVVIFMSCKWFTSHKNDTSNTSQVGGRYELISITDSSIEQRLKSKDTLAYFFNSPLKDSSKRYVNFSADSLVIYETANKLDSGKYYTDTADKIVYLENDSAYQPFSIIQSDSVTNLVAANDSIYIALKKL